ncbi:hypothetical protein RJ639_000330 [Escallonia herrerae]|uniref:Uncharacterized protein n=1 Tax=Escallonia herrerae TaxID=1293975 RepID=A0AA88X8Z0_9ASTE|nr:hypothetical protein RJ639_000330 [Escallonia herrerae]
MMGLLPPGPLPLTCACVCAPSSVYGGGWVGVGVWMSLVADSPVSSSSSDDFATLLDAELDSISDASAGPEDDGDNFDSANQEDDIDNFDSASREDDIDNFESGNTRLVYLGDGGKSNGFRFRRRYH